jgi:predicted ribosomally synthesized peptide with SipW-like signal peptide
MFNKKIILGVLAIGMLAIVASAGTYAYFQDVQTTANDVVNSGTIGLSIDGSKMLPFVANNAYPGQTDIPFANTNVNIKNVGTVPADLTCTCQNADGNAIANLMTIKVDGQTVWNNGQAATVTLKPAFAPTGNGPAYTPTVTYSFKDDNTDQTTSAQGKSFTFNLKFTLKTPPQ